MTNLALRVEGLSKTFTMHNQNGAQLPVLKGLSFSVSAGECLALSGPSGIGKSTVLRLIYGNYGAETGRILLRQGEAEIDLARADPRDILRLRRKTIGYVSQFLRVIPRVPTLEIVADTLRHAGFTGDPIPPAQAMLTRLRIPERLWHLAPSTFSGGEQQRVNLARVFVHPFPALLLDEPTASLDAANRQTVIELIQSAWARGAAVVGIFHDLEVRDAVATRLLDMDPFRAAA
ncbi:MAG: phosphonate C-P lyase system protein PhnL [Alphaproteobacteria bacterium]